MASVNGSDRAGLSKDLTPLLADWPAESGGINARKITIEGRGFIQLRVDLGILQMTIDGRPDGLRPQGFDSLLNFLKYDIKQKGDAFKLNRAQQVELTREMLQYYRRRISLMALAKKAHASNDLEEADRLYERAIRDADHNLDILDLLAASDLHITNDHEQYRPFIIMHRATCRAERALIVQDADQAIDDLKEGIADIERYMPNQGEDSDDPDLSSSAFINELKRFERHIRKLYHRRRTLREQLEDAVRAERFEQAARLRDALAEKSRDRQSSF